MPRFKSKLEALYTSLDEASEKLSDYQLDGCVDGFTEELLACILEQGL